MKDVFYLENNDQNNFFLKRCPSCQSVEQGSQKKYPDIILVKCLNCKLIYSSYRKFNVPRLQDDWLIDLDIIDSYYDPQFTEKNIYYLSFINKHIPKLSSILDVGAAYGAFVDYCRMKGVKSEGIELSSTACKVAFEKFGIKLINKKLDSSKDLIGSFDVITAFDVIEHIDQLDNFLLEIKNMLPEHGSFVLTVPNNRSLTNKLCFFSYKLTLGFIEAPVRMLTQTNYQSHHVSYFTNQSLRFALEVAGFKIIASDSLSTISKSNFFDRDDFGSRTKVFKIIGKIIIGLVQSVEPFFGGRDTLIIVAKIRK